MNSRAKACSAGSRSSGDGPLAPSAFVRRTDAGRSVSTPNGLLVRRRVSAIHSRSSSG